MLKIKENKDTFTFTIVSIILIFTGAIIIRLYYFTFEIPITYDSLLYLLYANTIAELGHLPINYSLDNNGWSIFLSLFFSFFSFNSAIDVMNLQKFISLFVSSITVIPIYFLIRKFFDSKYALIGIIIFAFEPRLIQNSLLGITEPLYILLLTITITLFLSNDKKIIYLSMVFASLSTLVRSEGLFLFIALSVMFFVQFRKDKLVIPKYLPVIGIFLLILLPMMSYQTEIRGDDRIFSRVVNGVQTGPETYSNFVFTGIENYIKFLIWDLIPIFIFFAPIGIILLLKNLNFRTSTILIYSIIMSLPALFAYAVPALDTRYLFFLYPGFCIMSIFTINKIVDKNKFKNYIIMIIIISIIVSSIIFIEYKKADNHNEKEITEVAKFVVKNTNGINDYYPNSKYIKSFELINKWPNVSINPLPFEISMIPEKGTNSLNDFILSGKGKGLSHLVIDDNLNRPNYLKDIFENEEKYLFLEKIFDSKNQSLNYKVKIFKINFNEWEKSSYLEEN
jgi:hypothetical protein